jgi:hypothetical protein
MIFALSFCITFSVVFLKSLQQKNINASYYLAMAVIGFAIGGVEVASAQIAVAGGKWIILSAGCGSALGIVLACWIHDYTTKRLRKQREPSLPLSPRRFRRA